MAVARSSSNVSLARSNSNKSGSGRMGEDVMNFRLQREQARIGSVTASLIWNDPCDLDLHAFVSRKAGGDVHISYRNKEALGGCLDVDMNCDKVSVEPIENIFWEEPPAGKYILKVQNFQMRLDAPDFTDPARKVPFRVSLKLKGGPFSFEGTVGPKEVVECFRFTIDEDGGVNLKPQKKGVSGLRTLKTMEVLRTVEKKVEKVLKTKKLRAVGPGAMKRATVKSLGAMKKAKKPMKKAMKVAMKKAMKKKKPMKKAMKPIKPMKRISTTAKGKYSMHQVLTGKKKQTVGGLKAKDIVKNKEGKHVSKKKSEAAKKSPWIQATKAARKALGITGFQTLGGRTPDGKAYLAKTREIFSAGQPARTRSGLARSGSGLARSGSKSLARSGSKSLARSGSGLARSGSGLARSGSKSLARSGSGALARSGSK